MNRLEHGQAVTRRHFLRDCQMGLGSIALGSMLSGDSVAADAAANVLAPRTPTLPAKAKSVIFLHMAGAPSQLDLFDPKPALNEFDGEPCPQELLEGKRFAFIQGVPTMLGSPFSFAQHGEAGTWVSETLPHFAEIVDDVTVIRSMTTDQFNHAPAQLLMQTGSPRLGGASMGSWVTYGLGSESRDLPGFVVLASGGRTPSAGKSLWGNGFLPTVYQGVQCRSPGEPVLYLDNPPGIDRSLRRSTLDAMRDLNQMQAEAFGDPETATRISQYELAFNMQMSVPEVMDISREPAHILEMYGARPGVATPDSVSNSVRPDADVNDPAFANNCLLARRMVESGVRFVQLYHWGWDHHGANNVEDLPRGLPMRCGQVDRAAAALVTDLKQRGMLDETLVVWGGEFGRTPMRENRGGSYGTHIGRDHHPYAFSIWMAGGGIKAGFNYGQTDDIGYYVTEDEMQPHDLQATILQLLGIDPFAFSYPFQGLNQRLIGPESTPRVITPLIA